MHHHHHHHHHPHHHPTIIVGQAPTVVVAPPSPVVVQRMQSGPMMMTQQSQPVMMQQQSQPMMMTSQSMPRMMPQPVAVAAPPPAAIVLPPRGTMLNAVVTVPPGHPAPYMPPPCDPWVDAQQIRAALKGNPLRVDGSTLITIICNRAINQLQAISMVYETQFGHSLKHGLKHEIKAQPHFRKLLVRRFRTSHEQKARALYKAVHHKGIVAVNDGRLVDVLAFTPNGEMPILKAYVRAADGNDLMTLVNRHTTDLGKFKEALDILIQGTRDENPTINTMTVAQDVQTLFIASDAQTIGHDTPTFINVLCRRAPWYNAAVNLAYGLKYKHDLIRAVDKTSMTANVKNLLKSLCLQPYEYWADRLYYAMKGAGTDDRTMVYVLSYLERNELQQVAQILHQRHPNHDLYKMIKGDLSGDYQHCALALCGQGI